MIYDKDYQTYDDMIAEPSRLPTYQSGLRNDWMTFAHYLTNALRHNNASRAGNDPGRITDREGWASMADIANRAATIRQGKPPVNTVNMGYMLGVRDGR